MKAQVISDIHCFSTNLTNVKQVSYSGQMKVDACERLLTFLLSKGLNITVFASDRSTSLRKMMARVFWWIKHNFDPW